MSSPSLFPCFFSVSFEWPSTTRQQSGCLFSGKSGEGVLALPLAHSEPGEEPSRSAGWSLPVLFGSTILCEAPIMPQRHSQRRLSHNRRVLLMCFPPFFSAPSLYMPWLRRYPLRTVRWLVRNAVFPVFLCFGRLKILEFPVFLCCARWYGVLFYECCFSSVFLCIGWCGIHCIFLCFGALQVWQYWNM